MNSFLIGQYNIFNPEKFVTDYREGFYGIEACSMRSEDGINALMNEVGNKDLNLGIHFPLRAGVFPWRDPLFLDPDPEKRRQALKSIEAELKYIKERNISPAYILFHYPKPVIVRDDFDFGRWRFKDNSEYVFESQYTFEIIRHENRNVKLFFEHRSDLITE